MVKQSVDLTRKMNLIHERYSRIYSGNEDFIQDALLRIMSAEIGLAPVNKPVWSCILVGETGTGKSWSVEALAEAMHGRSDSLIRIDGEVFSHSHNTANLIGAPAGYLGHSTTKPLLAPGRLAQSITKESILEYPIILVDEVDKAHDNLHQIFLGALNNGSIQMMDGCDRTDVSRCLIFFTTNDGVESMMTPMGFNKRSESKRSDAKALLSKRFSAPLLNRIDSVFLFSKYSRKELVGAIEIQCDRYLAGISHPIEASVEPGFCEAVLDTFWSDKFGIRGVVKEAVDIIRESLVLSLINKKDTSDTVIIPVSDVARRLEKKNGSAGTSSKAVENAG